MGEHLTKLLSKAEAEGRGQRVVWKFTLDLREITPTRGHKLSLPLSAKPVLVGPGEMPHQIFLWVDLPIDGDGNMRAPVDREFMVFGTGHRNIAISLEHVGSTIAGPYVWHVYERRARG